jgi:hypothetical protein
MHRASKETESLGSTIKHMAGAYIGFEALKMGAERIKEYVTGAIEGVSQTRILAERIGMSAESFGQLGYSARLAHIGQDELAGLLEQMNRRLCEVAIEGTGPAADALRNFGLSARQVANMGPEGALRKIVEVMQSIQSPAERAKVATDLFGKSGQVMIGLVAKGGEAIKEEAADASRLGFALSKIDSAKVAEAHEGFVKLQLAGEGFANLVVARLSPFISELVNRYIDWGYKGTKSASFITQGMDWVTSAIGRTIDGVHFLEGVFYSLQSAVSKILSKIAGGIDQVVAALDSILNSTASKLLAPELNFVWSLQSANVKKAVAENAEFFRDWSKDLDRVSKEEAESAAKHFAQVGQGTGTARKLIQDVENAAQERAKAQSDKSDLFNAPGGVHTKLEAPKFAGAAELGSKEAYSSVLKSRAQAIAMTEQRQIAANTAKTAEAGQQSVLLLSKIADARRVDHGLTPHLPAAF